MTKQSAKDVISRLRRRIESMLNDGSLDDISDGLQVKLGNASYSGGTIFPITFKFEVSATNEDGTIETQEARDFRANAILYGLSPDDLGKEFTSYTGEKFIITGLNRRRRKYPISATKDGKSYKFPAEQVKQHLQRAA
tara:strand:- start:582 stop:995 length:414 start_codon:yes stop_codon:yes gene_type:complete